MRPAPATPNAPAASRAVLRLALAAVVLTALAAGVAGGLMRAGVPLPEGTGVALGPAVAGHALLMICSAMGTVIGLERAMAVKQPLAFAGPVMSGASGLALLAGQPGWAAGLVVAASLAFVGVNLVVVRRQPAAHTVLLLCGALAWAVGSLAHGVGGLVWAGAVLPLWLSFLVLTIAAERLEMTRLMRRRPGAAPALYAVLAALVGSAAASGPWPVAGGVGFGLALLALAVWLLQFDIARRTVRSRGLPRYMAVCLLLGYAWLAVAGVAWAVTALGGPGRDAALHGLALGFVVSMMLGHAPVILPALVRIKLQFGWAFYLPLAVLQASLLLRLAGGAVHPQALAAGAAGNALALLMFLLTVVASALLWRRPHGASGTASAGGSTRSSTGLSTPTHPHPHGTAVDA